MRFDVRLLIGLMFLAFGVIVTVTGFTAVRTAGALNVDIVWGLVMAVFGAVMVVLALFAARRPRA